MTTIAGPKPDGSPWTDMELYGYEPEPETEAEMLKMFRAQVLDIDGWTALSGAKDKLIADLARDLVDRLRAAG